MVLFILQLRLYLHSCMETGRLYTLQYSLSIADNFKPPKRELEKAFRFCVSDVYKGKKVN